MKKEVVYLCIQPDDTYFTWQVHLWLESLKQIGKSNEAVVLVFTPNFREKNTKWDQVVALYPEAKFYFYKDEDNLSALLGIYIPVLRPYTMWRFLKENPEYCSKTIFYCDCDILFMPGFNIDSFLEDNINYVSDTNSYLNASYFDSKIKDVLPEKLEEYKTRDILSEVTSLIGITREICEANNMNSGGAQYLLKNTDSSFWSKVMNDCILIRTYLQKVNREYFKDENTGFQSWVADMLSVLWNLWLRNQKTEVVPELNFAWSTDPVEKLKETTILHNAGIVGEFQATGTTQKLTKAGMMTVHIGYNAFYKGKYHTGTNPMVDPHLDKILNDENSKKHCTWFYTKKLKELNQKYNLTY